MAAGAPGLAGDRHPTGDRLAISLMPAGPRPGDLGEVLIRELHRPAGKDNPNAKR
jgi:hypothetical protein